MDFFAAQDLRRKKTKWLVLLYLMAVVVIIVGVYAVFIFAARSQNPTTPIFDPIILGIIAVSTLAVVGGGSLYKIAEMRAGGEHIAAQLGGRRISASTTDPLERRLMNVVEEMALASGISMPPVYVLQHEPGINAFAAGYSPADAVIGVNRGALEQLNRDELQGVIAHEFSHILNGDMRINIRLIGILFGIQIIAMIGYFLLRSTAGYGYGYRRRSNDDSKGAGGIIVVAAALMILGYVGVFFARLIKASISREREYLADASAVQFTRYPDGIAGALKVIGSSAEGSRVQSPEAEQLSHMFFANGLTSALANLYSTHPPLVPRIQKVDTEFDGNFLGYFEIRNRLAAAREKKRAAKERKRQMDFGVSPASSIFPKSIAEKFSIDPAVLLAAIGAPNERDVLQSQSLIQKLPAPIVNAAKDAYSARCIAFALLASDDQPQRHPQLELIAKEEGGPTLKTTLEILPHVESLQLVFRLPMMELIQGALAELSRPQYDRFRQTVEALVRMDNKTSLFEFVIRHHLLMHLDRRFKVQPPPSVQYKSMKPLYKSVELMLSAFASAASSGSVVPSPAPASDQTVLASYRLAMQVAGFGDAAESSAELKTWEVSQLESCMIRLHRASMQVKKQFLHAAAVMITYDHEITIAEAEFFRAIAESLDCPVPLLAAGRINRQNHQQ